MIQQLGPPTFFVTFTSVERLWNPFIKILHTLHASRLNLPNKIKDLQFAHIVKLIRIDLFTCARYYDHKTFFFTNLSQKIIHFLGIFLEKNSSLNSKVMGVNMIMDFYGYKMHLCMECAQMKKLKSL
jgi:hypothetical protein